MAYHNVSDYIVTLDFYNGRWTWRVCDPRGEMNTGSEDAFTDAAQRAHSVIMRSCGTEIVWR